MRMLQLREKLGLHGSCGSLGGHVQLTQGRHRAAERGRLPAALRGPRDAPRYLHDTR